MLLEPNRFRGRCEPLLLGALLGAQRGGLLRFALTLGRGLLLMCLGPGRALRFLAVPLDLLLALLGRDFVLEALALELGLGLLRLQLRFGISLPCFGLTALRVGFSVDLRLLQATLPREITISGKRAGDLLRLAGNPASQTAGRSLRILLIRQIVLSFENRYDALTRSRRRAESVSQGLGACDEALTFQRVFLGAGAVDELVEIE